MTQEQNPDSNATPEIPRKRNRGIYLLPNSLTTAALFAGFYSIVSAINGDFEKAAIAIFVAMILDGLDGRVARMTNTQSEFGVQYDSLADMISFGLAPSLVMYLWSIQAAGKLGWLAAFIYTAGAALRLARFNTQVTIQDKRFFQGLPSPTAAAVVAGTVWMGVDSGIAPEDIVGLGLITTTLAGLFMVSNFRYYSFKQIDMKGKVPFVTLLAVVLVFVFVSIDPPIVLYFLSVSFALSGVVMTLLQLRKKRQERKQNQGRDISPD